MIKHEHDDVAESDPALAFEALRREVSFTRSAVEGLTAARERIPDYSVTLGQMSESLKKAAASLDRVEHSPAVRLSPDAMATALIKASAEARAQDVRLLNEARDTLSQSIGRIDGMVERGQAVEGQFRRLCWNAAAGVLAGILLWSVLPGAIARSLPESWHVPEWMAARTIGTDERAAGERLTAAANQRQEPGCE